MQAQRVSELRAFTGTSAEQAAALLAVCDWSTEAAADRFFTSGMQGIPMQQQQQPPPAARRCDAAKVHAMFDTYCDAYEGTKGRARADDAAPACRPPRTLTHPAITTTTATTATAAPPPPPLPPPPPRVPDTADESAQSPTDEINEGGIERLCADLGIDVMDVAILILAWRMGAAANCTFARTEWAAGMAAVGCDSVGALREALPALREEAYGSPRAFESLYTFCHGFSCEAGQKGLEAEAATGLWGVLLCGAPAGGRFPLAPLLCRYVEEHHKHSISRDTWCLALEFLTQVGGALEGFDGDGAWPVLLDEFAEWVQEQGLQVVAAAAAAQGGGGAGAAAAIDLT